jgi:hypothetical protein
MKVVEGRAYEGGGGPGHMRVVEGRAFEAASNAL